MRTPKKNDRRIWVLLVEDEPVTALLMKEVLQTKYMLHHATYGQEALRFLENYEFDIILMDIDLLEVPSVPYLSGFDVVRHIRANGKYRDIKVIAVTINKIGHLREAYIDAGFNDYVQKPITPDQVMELIEAITN